jgi:hypothetical protein
MRRNRTPALLCLLLGLANAPAWACRPMGQNLVPDYTGEVFLGEALSVSEVGAVETDQQQRRSYPVGSWSNEGAGGNDLKARPRRIRFKVLHWLKDGTAKPTVVEVNGVVNSMTGTNCERVFDFSARAGDTRLVFGRFSKDGSFSPEHFVYIRKEDKGKIPEWLYRASFPNED